MKNISSSIGLAFVALPALILLNGCAGTPDGNSADNRRQQAEATTGDQGAPATTDANIARPASASADLPNLEDAQDFRWLVIADNEMFAYSITGRKHQEVCAAQLDLLYKAGWGQSGGAAMDIGVMMTRTLVKPGYVLTVICSDITDEGSTLLEVDVALNKSKK